MSIAQAKFRNTMKKLIAKVFGVELHANAQNINGRKSSGVEDSQGYQHWKRADGIYREE